MAKTPMRKLFALLLTFLACAHASAEPSSIDGTWHGHIGKSEVMVCLGEFGGSYYYLKHLRGIPLRPEEDDKTRTHWRETEAKTHAFDPKVTGHWTLQLASPDTLEGKWASPDGAKQVTIEMTRLGPVDPVSGNCGSEFNAPLIRALKIGRTAADFEGHRYQVLASSTGTSVALPATSAGLRKINGFALAWLKEQVVNAYGCAVTGGEDWSPTLQPKVWSRRWLVLIDTLPDTYCDGPHSDWSITSHNFDLTTGAEVDAWTWLKQGEESVAQAQGDQPPQRLRALLEKLNPRDDCDNYFWARPPYPTPEGLIFGTSYPHAARACEDDILVTYKALMPYLSAAGKAVARQMSMP